MSTTYYPYLGSGTLYAREAGTAAGLIAIGNTSKLNFAVEEDKKTLADYSKPGGGTYASVSRIKAVTAQFTVHDLNKTNVARALFGTEAVVTGAAVVDEAVMAYKGGIAKLNHPSPTAVVVTNSAGTTTYVANTDYEVRAGGILILDAGSITDGQSILVDYSFATYNKVEALTTGAKILELFFEGLNEANSGKPVLIDVYRLQLSPAKALALLGDDFAELEMEGEVLKDASKTGVGISQYFRARMA